MTDLLPGSAAHGMAATVASPCTGCSQSIHSPTLPYLTGWLDERAPIFRFVEVPHPGCDGAGTFWRLIPIMTVYAPAPKAKRWWQRRR